MIARSVSDSEQREILNAIPLTIKGNDAVRLVRELNKKSDGGLLRSYRSPQVDLDFNFTMHGVRESIFTQLERTGDLSNFAVVLANLNDVIENAALIERHRDKYKGTARENHSLIGTHVLVSTIGVKDAIVPVQLEVKEYSGQSNRLYITLTLGEIEKATIFEGRPGDVSSTLPTIKLSELFKNVNSNETDFLKYIPDQFLNEDQLEGKQRGLEEEREKIAKYTIDDGIVKRSVEADPEILKALNSEPTVKVYRAMQVIDGKLFPPMAAKVDGALVEPTETGVWYRADERPDLIKNGKFKLDKANGSAIEAAYNPYWHTSRSMLNDQFSSAYKRPNLVTVECEVPASELSSGYKAEYANNTHSAIFTGYTGGGAPFASYSATSKWGTLGVFVHGVTNVPAGCNYSTVSIWHR